MFSFDTINFFDLRLEQFGAVKALILLLKTPEQTNEVQNIVIVEKS